jgi:hypothetical protein
VWNGECGNDAWRCQRAGRGLDSSDSVMIFFFVCLFNFFFLTFLRKERNDCVY